MKRFGAVLSVMVGMSVVVGKTTFAAEYPILAQYKTVAQELVRATETARSPDELGSIEAKTRELIQLGVEIMDLYASKNPSCSEQFAVMISEVPQMESMSVTELHSRYHDGVGLPAAPKHCYFGRSQVVHPAMNLVRLRGQWTDQAREAVLDEFDEVIEHLARIQKNLDTPPH